MLTARTPAEFAASTLQLLGDPATRETLGQSARDLVAARYSWDTLLPSLDSIYRG